MMMNASPIYLPPVEEFVVVEQGSHLPCTLSSSLSIEGDSLAQYCRDIAAFSLLSAEEEYALAVRVRNGDQDAKRALIEGNVRLVMHAAKAYVGYGLDLIDLIQEGNIGLLKAVERYDPSKGFRFSTYALYWIRQSISRALANTARTIRFPVHVHAQIHTLTCLTTQLFEEQGNMPTPAQLAEASDMTRSWVEYLLVMDQPVLSLDHPISGHDDTTLAETIADKETPIIDDLLIVQAHRAELPKRVRSVLTTYLSAREREVITLSFGLDDGVEHTQAEIGRLLGLSRERIRQLYGSAVVKLRRAFQARNEQEQQSQAS